MIRPEGSVSASYEILPRDSADESKQTSRLQGLIEDDPIMGESLLQRLELESYRAN